MSVKNNNTHIVKRLTRGVLKENKTRNKFLIMAVALTTFMLFTVAIFMYSMIINSSIMWTRILGTSANMSLSYPTEAQIEQIEDFEDIQASGIYIDSGKVTNEALALGNEKIWLEYYDNECFEEIYSPALTDIVGKYPVDENEIMVSKRALDYLEYYSKGIGDTIELSFVIDEREYVDTFIISGIFTDYGREGYTNILVSEDFVNEYDFNNEDVILYMKTNLLDRNKVSDRLRNEVVLEGKQNLNFAFDIESVDSVVGSVSVGLILSLFFVLSGFLLIYNIMYISVVKDINFYGLLKTIGTSPRQLKKIVSGQVYLLSVIGIPLGMGVASVVSYVIMPNLFNYFYSSYLTYALPKEIYFNPIIFILTIVFVFFTIFLSCRKPAKLASKISPVEATRFTGVSSEGRKKDRKSTSGGKLSKMAWYNVTRDRKRLNIAILSLFLGIITYLGIATFINALDLENYINLYAPYDFELSNSTLNSDEPKDYFTDEFITEISGYMGVTSVDTRSIGDLEIELNEEILLDPFAFGLRFEYEEEEAKVEAKKYYDDLKSQSDFVDTRFIGITEDIAQRLYEESEGGFDLVGFNNGEIALMTSRYYYYEPKVFESNLCVKSDIDGSVKDFDLIALENTNYVNTTGITRNVPTFAISQSALEELTSEITVKELYINCEVEAEEELNTLFTEYANERNIYITSKSSSTKNLQEGKKVMGLMGGFISFILIFTGVLNFVNLIVTNLNSRSTELALLESVGMTKSQISKLITYEAMYYVGITMGLILTVGLGILYGIGVLTEIIADYAIATLPFVEICVIFVLIIVMSLITTKVVYRGLSKKSIIERLNK